MRAPLTSPFPWTLVKMHVPATRMARRRTALSLSVCTELGPRDTAVLRLGLPWVPHLGTCRPLRTPLLLERNGSLGLGPRAQPPGSGWAGIEGGGAGAAWPALLDSRGCRNRARGRWLLPYTHLPTPPQAPTSTVLKFGVMCSQGGGHPGCWPFLKVYQKGLPVIRKKKFWSS